MLSDIYNTEIFTIKSKEGPALGVAILAMVGAGIYESVEEACKACIEKATVTEPAAENHEKYMSFYELYKSLYPVLKESYKALAAK